MKRYALSSTVESIPDSVPAPKRQRIAPGEPPAKQLERLLCSKKPSHDFNLLGTQQQQLLFSYLLGEYQHLRNYLHESHCPEADRAVVLHNRDRFSQEAADTLLERPRIDWSYADDSFEPVERIRWCSFDLFRPSAPQQSLQLEVCTSGDERRKHAVEKSFFLHDAISSQLLYYRLAVVFGMPEPVITDEYKTCWSVVLQFRDKTGRLELSDSKGGAWAAFCGSEDASKAALWLLGWIVSDQVPHTYDGVCDI
ncbi:hypothetical protein F5883DRAFT_580783 [Diaporthe sp. PMI_573]|nr:hypothetical protein F5883DRAFT_580783 [Diaporthaceae sp. PMI_573]